MLTKKQIKAIEELTDTEFGYVNEDEIRFYPNDDRGDASRAFFVDKNWRTKKLEIIGVSGMWIKVEWLAPLAKILEVE